MSPVFLILCRALLICAWSHCTKSCALSSQYHNPQHPILPCHAHRELHCPGIISISRISTASSLSKMLVTSNKGRGRKRTFGARTYFVLYVVERWGERGPGKGRKKWIPFMRSGAKLRKMVRGRLWNQEYWRSSAYWICGSDSHKVITTKNEIKWTLNDSTPPSWSTQYCPPSMELHPGAAPSMVSALYAWHIGSFLLFKKWGGCCMVLGVMKGASVLRRIQSC